MNIGEKQTLLEEEIRRLLSRERKIIKSAKRESGIKSKSKLYMRYRNNKPYFYEHTDKWEKGISNDTKRIDSLIRKEMIAEYITSMEYNCNLLENTLAKFKKVNLSRLSRILEALNQTTTFYTKEQLNWMTGSYKANPYHPEHLKYSTTNGVKVRSKSERAIGNRLELLGTPYRYEPQMIFGGKTIYPDFVILRNDDSIVIWEHFGLMNEDEYKRNAMNKINLYRQHGFVQHNNLICTWEEDIQNTSNIDQIITRFTHY